MIRNHKDVPKRARNSINIQVNKLIDKWGEKEVRLVSTHIFEVSRDKKKLEAKIASDEKELNELKAQR